MSNSKEVLIIKIGSAVLMDIKTKKLELSIIDSLASQISELHKTYNIVLVTSGAVSAGSQNLLKFSPESLVDKKSAAAIGNPILINKYQKSFDNYDLNVAQILCERHHFSNNELSKSLQSTVQNLWKNRIIPIFNENDPIVDYEMRFSDNDHLSVLVAILFDAKKLLLGTVVDGLINKQGLVVSYVEKFSPEIFSLVNNDHSSIWGIGGMRSKLNSTKIATSFGIEVVIFNAKITNNILQAIKSKTGTTFSPQKCLFSDKQKELIYQIPSNKIFLNKKGASRYQHNFFHKNSIKSEDIESISKGISSGEIVEIFSSEESIDPLALGIVSLEDAKIFGLVGGNISIKSDSLIPL
jgi:glutamate 5-kinase